MAANKGYVDTGLSSKQATLVSGTNIKTINNQSLLGNGNITISSGGTATDVQVNGSSIVSNNVADLATEGTYNATTNKLATMADVPTVPTNVSSFTNDAGYLTSYTETDPVFAASAAHGITSSDITSWNGKIDKNVNDLTNYYTKTEVDGKVSSVYKYKGSVSTYSNLPSTGLTTGDVYNVESDGQNYAWTGSAWDALGGTVDLSGYQTKIDSTHKLSSDLVDDTNKTNKFVTSSEKSTWNAKYDKPSGGIPSTDLSSAVQTSLGKADTALQSETYTGTITSVKMNGSTIATSGEADLGTVITDISGKQDKIDSSHKLSADLISDGTTNKTVTATEKSTWSGKQDALVSGTSIKTINSTSLLGSGDITVSTFSGSYNDLTDKPTIPDELADLSDDSTHRLVTDTDISAWNGKSDFSGSYTDLTDKPSIPSATSDLTNDSGFISSESDPTFTASAAYGISSSDVSNWDGKQDALVSGTNIKTINNESLLGSGNITISSGTTTDVQVNGTSITSNGVANLVTETAYDSSTNKLATVSDILSSNDVVAYKGKIKANGSVYGTQLIFPTEHSSSGEISQRWSSICKSRSTGTSKTATTTPLMTNTIAYYSGTNTITSGNAIPEDKVFLSGPVDIRYCFNVSSLTAGKPVYLKLSAYDSSSSLKVLYSSQWWTQDFPTSKDNYYYMYLGDMVDATTMMLFPEHPIYVYNNGMKQWNFLDVYVDNKSTFSNGCYHIPSASTSAYGVTKLSTSTSSTETNLAATPSAVKAAYDLANGKQAQLVSGTNIKTINNQSILGSGNIQIESEKLPDKIVQDVKVNGNSITSYTMSAKQVNEQQEGSFDISNSTFVIDTTGHTSAELTTGIVDGESNLFAFAQLDYTDPSNPTLEYMYGNSILSGDMVNAYVAQIQASVLLPSGSSFTDTIASDHYYYLIIKIDSTYTNFTMYILEDLTALTNYGNFTFENNCVFFEDVTYGTPNTAIWDSLKLTGLSQGTGEASLSFKTINNQSILGTGNISISGGGGGGGQPDLVAIDGLTFNLWDLDTGMYILMPDGASTTTMSYYSDGVGTVDTLVLPENATITAEKYSGSTESEGVTLSADVITFIIHAYSTGIFTGNQIDSTFSSQGQSISFQSGSIADITSAGGIEVNTFEDLPSNVPEYTKAYVKNATLYDTTTIADLEYDISAITDLSPKSTLDFSGLSSSDYFTITLKDYLDQDFGIGLLPSGGEFILMMGNSVGMTTGYDYVPPIYIYATGTNQMLPGVPEGWCMYVNGSNVFVPIDFNDIPLVPIHLMTSDSYSGDPTLADDFFIDAKKHWAGEYRYIGGEWVYQGTVVTPYFDSNVANVPNSRLIEYLCKISKDSMQQINQILLQLAGGGQ